MVRKTAAVFVYLFSPLLMPTYILLVRFAVKNTYITLIPSSIKWFSLALTFSCTFLMPILIMFYMKKKKILSDFSLSEKDERSMFYGVALLFYALLTYSFLTIENYPIIFSVIPVVSASVLAGLILVNFFTKASSHVAALSGIIAYFSLNTIFFKAYSLFFILLHIVLAGIVGSSQIVLGQHTNRELLVSCVVGIVSTAIAFILFYWWNFRFIL